MGYAKEFFIKNKVFYLHTLKSTCIISLFIFKNRYSMNFFSKLSSFEIFHKQEQKRIWKKVVGLSLLGVFFIIFLYFYLLFSPFRGFFWKMPSMLGFFGRTNYLMLIQNNSESRPTGGFITAYGELSFLFGVPSITIKDSYDINPPEKLIEPPYPLNELLEKDIFYKGFVFRDANWSPDFPTSVKNIVALYNEGYQEIKEFDGVIAVNLSIIEKLLSLFKEIKVGEESFDSKNFFHKTQFYSKNIDLHSVEELGKRKNIMKEFVPIFIKKLLKSPSKYSEVIQMLEEFLDTKDIQLNFTKKSYQKIAEEKGWAGKFEPKTEDFIHINIANIGGRKGDRYILPTYNYTVLFDENNQGKVNLDIEFHYQATQGLYTDFYQAYIRTYVPKRISELKKWGDNKSEFKVEEDLDVISIGTLINIWPGETKELHFSYNLPADILPYDYNLQLIPMSGNFGEQWGIALKAKNSDNFWESENFEIRENMASFRKVISKDTVLSANLKEDTTPPVIIWQKFLDKDRIELLISERLNPETLKDSNFSIKDKNIKNSEVKNSPVVLNAWQDDSYRLFLKLNAINWQIGEHFSLTIENISDVTGNMIYPNPKEITLVQR